MVDRKLLRINLSTGLWIFFSYLLLRLIYQFLPKSPYVNAILTLVTLLIPLLTLIVLLIANIRYNLREKRRSFVGNFILMLLVLDGLPFIQYLVWGIENYLEGVKYPTFWHPDNETVLLFQLFLAGQFLILFISSIIIHLFLKWRFSK